MLPGNFFTVSLRFLNLQARLPEARVIYCSATGASEPRNMGYMVRLGLWGAGTYFSDFASFLGLILVHSFIFIPFLLLVTYFVLQPRKLVVVN